MNTAKQPTSPILRIPNTVREDVLGYREQVAKFLRGEIKPISFKAYRVPMGIYEQRTEGKYMVRIRIGAGMALAYQLERIAELSKTYGNGVLHVTTRQDIQIHEVTIENTPDVLEGLLEVGLSARGGGGNTVRNVTACSRAGVCPKEQFDVAPYSIATAEYLLQDRSSFNLPRKYKIVFSGCSDDCALASVADLGFFACHQNSEAGFAAYAGGGLGPNAAVAVKIEDFIEADQIFAVAEAIKRLFDKHGDRSNKHKARLRYVLARVGPEEFVKLYKQERDEIKASGLSSKTPEIRDIATGSDPAQSSQDSSDYGENVMAEKAGGTFTVRLRLKHGDISSDNLKTVAQIAARFGRGPIRTTQLQDLLICGIRAEDIEKVANALKPAGIDVAGDLSPKIVTCTGAATCKLGLCLSRGLGDAIASRLGEVNGNGQVIRISGCPNSCGHHYIASIGFQGKAKRINGRLMPCYDVLAGAKIHEGESKLAEKVGTIPAKKIPDFVAQVFTNGLAGKDDLKALVAQYGELPAELPDDFFFDYGSDEPFSLAGRGPGECGAGVMDVMKVDIDEAKEAIKTAGKISDPGEKSEALYQAIVSGARALLFVFGMEPKKDREIFAAFAEYLIEPGWVAPQTQQLLDAAVDWRMGDKDSIADLAGQAGNMAARIEELFLSLDANLKFRAEPITEAEQKDTAKDKAPSHIIDLRGVTCPLNFVKAKIALEKIPVGQVLEVLLDEGEPVRNVPESFNEQGQEIVEIKNNGDHFCVKVHRKY
ncbi:MAG: sulfurtransferase TusA family protein [Planctomycetota bacterium]|jgi:sulfite reductase (ferredoxin)